MSFGLGLLLGDPKPDDFWLQDAYKIDKGLTNDPNKQAVEQPN